jgi:DNA helicase II / ATP-dependent DNA helicase PcrA
MIDLDRQQLEAIQVGAGPAMVVAAAGSGKTSCLTERIAFLVEGGVDPSTILAVTFTTAAAEEMRVRVAERLGLAPRDLKSKICTLHSLGFGILAQWGARLGYKTSYMQASNSRAFAILRACLREPNQPYSNMDARVARAYIAAAKRKDVAPGELVEGLTDPRLTKLYIAYEKEKVRQNVIEFDDMTFKAWRLLRDNEGILERYRSRYRWILEDEAHDQDLVQLRILMAIAAPRNNLWLVEDVCQSIYSFRGANPELCIQFPNMLPGCKVIHVGHNYRSRPTVVALMKEVIAASPYADEAFMNSIVATRPQDGVSDAVFVRFINDLDEARYVADEIVRLKYSHPKASFAVIYRMNRQSRLVEEELFAAGLDYVVRGAASFFRLPEVESAIAFLEFVEDPENNDAIERLATSVCPACRGLGPAFVKELMTLPLSHYEHNLIEHQFKRPQTTNAARRLLKVLSEILDACSTLDSLEQQLKQIYALTGLVTEEEDDEAELRGDNDRVENLKELLRAVKRFGSRASFLTYVKSFRTGGIASGAVELLSGHRSKGLQYDFVFIIGADEEILPHKNAMDIEEERRLAYVMVSRAKEVPYVLSHSSPSKFFARWPERPALVAEGQIFQQ